MPFHVLHKALWIALSMVYAARKRKNQWACVWFGIMLSTLYSPQWCSSDPSLQSVCPSHTLGLWMHKPSLHLNSSCSWQAGRERPETPETQASRLCDWWLSVDKITSQRHHKRQYNNSVINRRKSRKKTQQFILYILYVVFYKYIMLSIHKQKNSIHQTKINNKQLVFTAELLYFSMIICHVMT